MASVAAVEALREHNNDSRRVWKGFHLALTEFKNGVQAYAKALNAIGKSNALKLPGSLGRCISSIRSGLESSSVHELDLAHDVAQNILPMLSMQKSSLLTRQTDLIEELEKLANALKPNNSKFNLRLSIETEKQRQIDAEKELNEKSGELLSRVDRLEGERVQMMRTTLERLGQSLGTWVSFRERRAVELASSLHYVSRDEDIQLEFKHVSIQDTPAVDLHAFACKMSSFGKKYCSSVKRLLSELSSTEKSFSTSLSKSSNHMHETDDSALNAPINQLKLLFQSLSELHKSFATCLASDEKGLALFNQDATAAAKDVKNTVELALREAKAKNKKKHADVDCLVEDISSISTMSTNSTNSVVVSALSSAVESELGAVKEIERQRREGFESCLCRVAASLLAVVNRAHGAVDALNDAVLQPPAPPHVNEQPVVAEADDVQDESEGAKVKEVDTKKSSDDDDVDDDQTFKEFSYRSLEVSPSASKGLENATIQSGRTKLDHRFQGEFGLPDTETAINTFSCAFVKSGFPLHGRMYLSRSFLCFSSPLLSLPLKVKFSSITKIEKSSRSRLLPSNIRICTALSSDELLFTSFMFMEQALASITELWRIHTALADALFVSPHNKSVEDIEDVNSSVNGAEAESATFRVVDELEGLEVQMTGPKPSTSCVVLDVELDIPLRRLLELLFGIDSTLWNKFLERDAHLDATLSPWTRNHDTNFQRTSRSRKKVSAALILFASSEIELDDVQTLSRTGMDEYQLDIMARSSGHPYADTFNVHIMWTLSAGASSSASRIRVAVDAVFLKATMLKGTIRKNIMREARESYQILQQLLHDCTGVSGRQLRSFAGPPPLPMTPRAATARPITTKTAAGHHFPPQPSRSFAILILCFCVSIGGYMIFCLLLMSAGCVCVDDGRAFGRPRAGITMGPMLLAFVCLLVGVLLIRRMSEPQLDLHAQLRDLSILLKQQGERLAAMEQRLINQ